ncbi:MAG: RdgB/HAM1 family non-canonical purine NTP pyrophosphatase [Leptolyngbyaceae cyanobacterium bins.59]|nr:RdgB/HAM1 family non-canonical purine NTP pyrophosphatase [Leptolyngbyaceae cyanobacterium bins.59]
MTTLIVATGNPGKVRELQTYLKDLNWQLQPKPDELDIEETEETFAGNACLKASQTALATGQWAIADDSGLEVAALNGAPGVFSARYGNSDADRIQRLLTELGDTPNRQAQFVCVIALARPDGTIALQVEGICPGEIALQPQGTSGFGYDPIFYVPELGVTFAEMTPEQKRRVSHRGRAITALLPQLEAL